MSANVGKVLIFDLKGPFAHFRKYYTNSSSLSYSFPPRTTIIGLVAGLLGFERDSYYESFNDDKCMVAVSIRALIRKIMQTMNYTSTKSYSLDKILAGGTNPTQIPLEVVCPVHDRELSYRIYFSHTDPEIYGGLRRRLEEELFVYPPYLGITEFIGEIDYINEGTISKPSKKDDLIDIRSVCRKNAIAINGLSFEIDGDVLQYILEKMPSDFSKDRAVTRYNEYAFEKNNNELRIKSKEEFFHLDYVESDRDVSENIIFM